MADPAIPLASYQDFTAGALGDLVSGYEESVINPYLVRATRMCERACARRLAPFTLTETHRAAAADPDQYGTGADLPLPIQGAIGWDFAQSLGASKLVRECWLNEYPKYHEEMWAYSDVTVTTILTYGGPPQTLGPGQILDGPDDTGHLWFQLGLFLPVGSRIRVTYSGGYIPEIPADLTEANCLMAANLIIRELNPVGNQRDPDTLRKAALAIMDSWGRNVV